MTEKFREYLLGHKCVVFTDNNPLSYLTSAKLGAMEQRWAAQLAFDFEIKYRSGRSNRNADALSRQNFSGTGEVHKFCPGMAVPVALQQAAQGGLVTLVNQVTSFPCISISDMGAQQVADSVIGELMVFWRRKLPPTPEERKKLQVGSYSVPAMGPPSGDWWSALSACVSFVRRRGNLPGAIVAVMKHDVLTQLHQQHGHQGE